MLIEASFAPGAQQLSFFLWAPCMQQPTDTMLTKIPKIKATTFE